MALALIVHKDLRPYRKNRRVFSGIDDFKYSIIDKMICTEFGFYTYAFKIVRHLWSILIILRRIRV